jgi:RimJ/RimL family protein N-acetyltransferase
MIETHRLSLREYKHSELDSMVNILGDRTTMELWPEPFSKAQIKAWIERSINSYRDNGYGRWLIINKDSQQVIGDCGIVVAEINGNIENDLGYIIHHPEWPKGFAYEAAAACVEYAFGCLNLQRLVANMAVEHKGSVAVAEKPGMRMEGQFSNPRNNFKSTLIHSLEREKESAMTRLMVLPHAETDYNRQGRCQGSIDTELRANGKIQAQRVATIL